MNNSSNQQCPFLGLKDDAHTSLGFPSNWNYCHRSQPVAAPRFKHQEEFCLGGKYGECPLYASEQAASLPHDLRIPRKSTDLFKGHFRRNATILLVVFIALLAGGWGVVSRQNFSTQPTERPTLTTIPFATSTLTVTPPATIAVSIVSTMTLSPNDTTTIDFIPTGGISKNQLEVLIGTDYKFVIHKILEGETMEQFEARYNTSKEAIVGVNYTKRNPGWSGTLLVIPVGFTDFSELPSFVVYQVQEKDRGVSVETMAKYLRVNPLDLKYYNGWTSTGDRPLVGDYLLVPRPRPVQ